MFWVHMLLLLYRLCMRNGDYCFLVSNNVNFMKKQIKVSVAEAHTFAHHNISIPLLLQLFILLYVWCKADMSYSILSSVKDNACHADKVIFRSMFKHALPGKLYEENCRFSSYGFQMLFTIVIISWIGEMLLLAGDIHPNPGPSTVSSVSSVTHLSSALSAAFNFSNLSSHL